MSHPKKIWSMWYQGYENAPGLVKQCLGSWRRFNPGYEMTVLDKESLPAQVEFPVGLDIHRPDIPVQKIAALSRLALLEKHGGVWVDATVHCCRSLDDWLPAHMEGGFFAFRNPRPDRMMSNWFLAAQPDNPILATLYRELTSFFVQNRFDHLADDFGRQAVDALTPILNTGHERTLLWFSDIVTKGLKVYPYFIFHYAFNKVILENPDCRALWESSPGFSADIPHALQRWHRVANGGDATAALAHISSGISPVYKLNWRDDAGSAYLNRVLGHLAEL